MSDEGRIAYEAFIEHAPESNHLPPWGAIGDEKREAWRAVAHEVLAAEQRGEVTP